MAPEREDEEEAEEGKDEKRSETKENQEERGPLNRDRDRQRASTDLRYRQRCTIQGRRLYPFVPLANRWEHSQHQQQHEKHRLRKGEERIRERRGKEGRR
jgi:hypothetical protein